MPTMTEAPPMMRKGSQGATVSRSAMVGASSAPSLARVEHMPANILCISLYLIVKLKVPL